MPFMFMMTNEWTHHWYHDSIFTFTENFYFLTSAKSLWPVVKSCHFSPCLRVSFVPSSHPRPLRVMYDDQLTRATWPSPSPDHPHSQDSSIITATWLPEPSPSPLRLLTDAWCLNSCQFGKFSIDERVAWVFTSNLIFNSCNFIANPILPCTCKF